MTSQSFIYAMKMTWRENQVRIKINQEIIGDCTSNIHEVWSKGNTLIEKVMYLVHFGDWVSWYLSEIREMDAIEVNVIKLFKRENWQNYNYGTFRR